MFYAKIYLTKLNNSDIINEPSEPKNKKITGNIWANERKINMGRTTPHERMGTMAGLNFDERSILAAYRYFYGKNYPAAQEENTDAHVQAQKMCFLLSLKGIRIGDFGYSWNFHGPYSAGLQSQLRALDENEALVKTFYQEFGDGTQLMSDDSVPGSLFSISQGENIKNLARSLRVAEKEDECRQWSELLGSLAFLSCSVYPGEQFETVNNELKVLKPQYTDKHYNRAAWKTLEKSGILLR